jgi:hypothetical protein
MHSISTCLCMGIWVIPRRPGRTRRAAMHRQQNPPRLHDSAKTQSCPYPSAYLSMIVQSNQARWRKICDPTLTGRTSSVSILWQSRNPAGFTPRQPCGKLIMASLHTSMCPLCSSPFPECQFLLARLDLGLLGFTGADACVTKDISYPHV